MEVGLGEGPLQRQLAAEKLVHQSVSAETADYEDHTFAGIMFDIRTHKLPAEYIEVQSIWLRGDLGPITVWSTPGGFAGKQEEKDAWTCHHNQTHNPSPVHLREMRFNEPLRLEPGATQGLYAHSAMPGDEQIVYDNQRSKLGRKPRDSSELHMDILPGMAHLSDAPFSGEYQNQFWGWWGTPWRSSREFVGRISYGVRWLLWNPDVHSQMPPLFQKMVWAVLMSRHVRARGSFLHHLETDMLLFILNKVEWWEAPAVMDDLRETRKGGARKGKKKAKSSRERRRAEEEDEEEEEEEEGRRASKKSKRGSRRRD